MIDWDSVLSSVKCSDGEIRTIGVDFYKNEHGQFNEIIQLWNDAGYTSNKVEWINYYPGVHFNKDVEEKFARSLNVNPIRSWISCIRPGKSAPWHQDVDDSMSQYKELGNLVRYTCHIDKPSLGQILLIEKDSFYMVPQGTVTKWHDYMAWHGSSNCGFNNHYLYHFLGYENI